MECFTKGKFWRLTAQQIGHARKLIEQGVTRLRSPVFSP